MGWNRSLDRFFFIKNLFLLHYIRTESDNPPYSGYQQLFENKIGMVPGKEVVKEELENDMYHFATDGEYLVFALV